MVPAIALADEAVEPAQDDALELLAYKAGWAEATVALSDGGSYTAKTGVKIANDGAAHKLTVNKVQPAESDKTYTVAGTDFIVKYYEDDNDGKGNQIEDLAANADKETITAYNAKFAKSYWIGVTAGEENDFAGSDELLIKVTISGHVLDGAVAVNKVTQKEGFTFGVGSTDLDLKSAITFKKDSIVVDDEIESVKFALASEVASASDTELKGSVTGTAVDAAGDWVALLLDAEENVLGVVEFTVAPLDLSKAAITTVAQQPGAENDPAVIFLGTPAGEDPEENPAVPGIDQVIATIDGIPVDTGLQDGLTLSYVQGPGASKTGWGAAGTYTYKLADADTRDGSIIGSTNITIDSAAKILETDNFAYDDGAWPATGKTIDLTKGASWNEALIGVADGDVVFTADQYEVTYKNEDGEDVDASALTEPGMYLVTVRVLPDKTDYAYAGTENAVITVQRGNAINADKNVKFKKDGITAEKFTADYTGSDQLGSVAVTVADAKGNVLVEGTDYDLVYKNKATGKTVTEGVNVGTYTIGVKLKNGYAFDAEGSVESSKAICELQIKAIEITGIRPAGTTKTYKENRSVKSEFYPYTGEVIEASYEYTTGTKAEIEAETAKYVALPADSYSVAYTLDGKAASLKEVGEYKAKFTPATTNFTLPDAATGDGIDVTVSKSTQFVDVPNGEWYTDPISTAFKNGYMTGYAGTDLFGPNDTMTRGQMAVVLYKMAGGTIDDTREGYEDDEGGYPTKFTDVDKGMYYAKAVQWGVNRGIISGYSETTFAPNDPVTREQFATFLQRYAKAMGKDVTATGDLSAYADAAAVDSWATDAVKWAVANNIMGVNTTVLTPTKSITRAEAAAMAVRYQPTKL